MNTRQLSQGLVPTEEYERQHAFRSLRQFPALRLSAKEVEEMKLRKRRERGTTLKGPSIFKTTYRLEQLSKSSLEEVSSVMTDYRRILMENRRVNTMSSSASCSSSSSSRTRLDMDESEALTRREQRQKEAEEKERRSPLELADQKLTKVSISFDAKSYNSHLSGFQGARLDKKEFNALLCRCLNVRLNGAELDALFDRMDQDQSKKIDGVEFVRYFFALGNSARWNMQLETMAIRAKKTEAMKRRQEEEEARIRDWEAKQITHYTDRDRESAFQKLRDLSLFLEVTDEVDGLYLRGFEGRLTAYQFKQQVNKLFSRRLSASEISALIAEFQITDEDTFVDGSAFLRRLQELQQEAQKIQTEIKACREHRKQVVIAMGQNVNCLPKCLGR